MEVVDVLAPGAASGSELRVGEPTTVGAGGTNKIKISSVLEQGSDVEVAMHSPAELLEFRRAYVVKMGGEPMEKED
eukprot:1929923-Amphidinium_carterae.1